MAVRVIVLLGLALVIGVGTVIFAQKWIEGQRQPAPPPEIVDREIVPDLSVLVAQGNLQPGMLIGPESLRWQGWPTEDVPPTYVVEGKRAQTEFHGAVVRYPISAGEPITDFKVAKPGEQGFLAAVLEPGMRAVTLPISAVRASAGFILPGDRVDVLLTHDPGTGSVAETVFFDMKVLAIDQALSQGEGAVRLGATATLQVTPREVEAFTLMQQMGALSLSLRSLQPGEGEEPKPQPAGLDEQTEQMAGAGMEAISGDTELTAEADAGLAGKPEEIEKVPTVYPGEAPDEPAVTDGGPQQAVGSVANAVGQSLGETVDDEGVAGDEHATRRQGQTFTSTRDISVLIGGGGNTGAVVVIRGN